MSARTTLLFIPGAYHTPSHYATLLTHLQTTLPTVNIIPIHLPTVGSSAAHAARTRHDDIALIASTVTAAAENGDNIILFMHSYGGSPGTEALAGLSKAERAKRGRPGGVVRLIYLSAIAVDTGFDLLQGGKKTPAPFIVEDGPNFFITPPAAAIAHYYTGVDASTAQQAASSLQPLAQGAFTTPPTSGYAAFKYIPSTYIQCLRDEAVPMFWQDYIVKQEGALFDVEKLDAGHSPFLSMPEETVEVVVKAIRKTWV